MAEMKQIDPPERTRVYIFPNGVELHYKNVIAVGVSESGTHRLELAESTGIGRFVIIPPGFIAIELDIDDWTF